MAIKADIAAWAVFCHRDISFVIAEDYNSTNGYDIDKDWFSDA